MRSWQQGLTLVELLIAAAVAGLIVGVLSTVIYQTFTVTEYSNDKMTAMHELQNVAHWVSLDVRSASTATGGDELVLTLPDDSSITYTLEGSELRRTAGDSQITIAQNISSVSFSVNDNIITMTVTSSPEGRPNVSEQGVYNICLRVTEEQEE